MMTHTYQLTGITCSGCTEKIKKALLMIDDVSSVDVSLEGNAVTMTMNTPIPLSTLQEAIGGENGKYKILALPHQEENKLIQSWIKTYKPILLIFSILTTVSIMVGLRHGTFQWMQAMAVFMAGFFLVFSFFKLLDLEAFAESYAMYDVIAMKYKNWGYIYAGLELGLGFGYILKPDFIALNLLSLILMLLSSIGVIRSLFHKQKIQCACLGTVFNLPMSTVTVIENGWMIVMSWIMILGITN